jgi:hypothetical protein
MNTRILRQMVLLGMAGWAWNSLAQTNSTQTNYTINYYSVDGGGGTSTGGVYSVNGTLGQPDAGAMSGGDFSVVGGFWSVIALQTPGAPRLSLRVSNDLVVVSWPLPDTGWKLQSTANLVTPGSLWADYPPPYQTNSTDLYYTEPLLAGKTFYRLKK